MSHNSFIQSLDPSIISSISGSYGVNGKWTKICIKREYKDNPAIFLDMWNPYPKSRFLTDRK